MTEYEIKLRDDFAKIAFEALLKSDERMKKMEAISSQKSEGIYSVLSRHAYAAADRAIEARKNK